METVQPTQELYAELQQAYDFFNRELFEERLPGCLLTLQRKKRTRGYFSPQRFINNDGEKTDEIALNPAYFPVLTLAESMSVLVHEMVHQYQYCFGEPGRKRYHNEQFAELMEGYGLLVSDTGTPGGKRTGERMSHYIEEGGLYDQVCARLPEGFRLSWMDRFPPPEALRRLAADAEAELDRGRAADEDDEPDWVDREDEQEELELDPAPSVAGPTGEEEDTPVTGEPEEQNPESATLRLERLRTLGLFVEVPGPEAEKNLSNRVKYSCPLCDVNVWGKPRLNLVCGDCSESFEAV